MKTIIYIIAGLILLAIGPQLILGIIFTVGIYYFLLWLFRDSLRNEYVFTIKR